MKKIYSKPSLEVELLSKEDVITTSSPNTDVEFPGGWLPKAPKH